MAPALISVVVPVHNEAGCLLTLYKRLAATLEQAPRYTAEILFVNDGSTDESQSLIESLARSDGRVRFIELSRNFGKEVAVTAGIAAAAGAAVVTLDADLQHPPERIPEFLAQWERGAEIVIGLREGDSGAGRLRAAGSYLFHRLMRLSDLAFSPGETDFRLIDRQVANELNRFSERNRITRGLIDWMGFRRSYVRFLVDKRHAGSASYSFGKLFDLALSGFLGNSLAPLKLAGYLGLFTTITASLLGSFMFLDKYVWNDPFHMNFSGPATLAVLILFLVGIVLICLGLMALYIARIHVEVVDRPLYIVRRSNIPARGRAAD